MLWIMITLLLLLRLIEKRGGGVARACNTSSLMARRRIRLRFTVFVLKILSSGLGILLNWMGIMEVEGLIEYDDC